MKLSFTRFLIIAIIISAGGTSRLNAQCNVNTSICTPGTAGPFNFVTPGPPVGSCLDWIGPSTGYILLNITASGNLNMLIDGNSATGFLDVAVFNIPNGVPPCNAIQNPANEINCNYASSSSGCNQFGGGFGCPSSVPTVPVTAGQTLMIVVENWSGASTNYTLSLATIPGSAQTGPPNSTINPAGPYCVSSAPAQLTAVNSGGAWSGPGVSATGMFNPATAGPGTHTINYSIGAAPCNSTSSIQITVNPLPVISVAPVAPICANQSATLNATGGTTYLWSTSANTSAITVTPAATTTYTVTGTTNGCSATATASVTVIPFLPLTINSPTICEGDSAWLIPGGADDYTWTVNGQISDSAQFWPVTQTDYTVVGTANGCQGTITATVYVTPNPVVTVNSPFTCPGIATTLTAGGATTYEWYDGSTNSTVTVPGIYGNYWVVGTANNCSDTAFADVTTMIQPELDITSDVYQGCDPLDVQFYAAINNYPYTSYSWDLGQGATSTLANPQFQYTTLGCHDVTLTATYATGCIVSQTVNCMVTVHPVPEANFFIAPSNIITTPTAYMNNTSVNGDTWEWSFGDGGTSTEDSPEYSFPNPGQYEITLIATSEHGCSDTVMNPITVNSEVAIYIPNSFTPNADKLNDEFKVVGKGLIEASMVIFDRWGSPLVSLDKDQPFNLGWDGVYNGEMMAQGVYAYKIYVTDVVGKVHEYSGHISLIR